MKASELKAKREEMGLLQVDLAERLGIHPMTLSKWERGVLPVPIYIELAMEALDARQKLASKKKRNE